MEKPVQSSGITAQTLIFHPYDTTEILLVHNLLEDPSKCKPVPGLPGQKPPGWGFPGGGVEPDELECLRQKDPKHWILNKEGFSEEERLIMAGALRETRDESGFFEVEIRPLPERIDLYRYKDRKTGHRKVLLHGELISLARGPINECDEVDMVDWFDIRKSLRVLFEDREKHPGFPYWSHIRAAMLGAAALSSAYDLNLKRMFHPSWRLCFSVGVYDERFPVGGFLIPPDSWYFLVQEMINEKTDVLTNGRIYEIFEYEILLLKAREEEWERQATKKKTDAVLTEGVESAPEGEKEDEEVEANIIDYGGSIPADVIKEQDRQWLEWAERSGIIEEWDE